MAGLTNCIFLYLGKKGICPKCEGKKVCQKKCDKFAEVGDSSTQIFKDWDEEIEAMRLRLREKYFCEQENIDEYKDLLG